MIYVDTTRHVSTATLVKLMSHRIQGRVKVQRNESIYIFHCQRTPEFYQVVSFIQEHGGFPIVIEGDIVVVKQNILSKL